MFDTINLSFTKGYFILYDENKIAFCFKRGVLLDLKISEFGWKMGCFSRPRPESAKGGIFQAWVRLGTSVVYIHFGRDWGGGGGGGVLIQRFRLNSIGIPMVKIRRSRNSLIFNMGIPTPGKMVSILRRGGGGVLIQRFRLNSIGIPMVKIRRSRNSLIFNMGIPTPGKMVSILRRGPDDSRSVHKEYRVYLWNNIYTMIQSSHYLNCKSKSSH